MPIGLEKGTLAVPEDNSKPVVLIGPGTGVAPMRAIIEYRVAMGARGERCQLSLRTNSGTQANVFQIISCILDVGLPRQISIIARNW